MTTFSPYFSSNFFTFLGQKTHIPIARLENKQLKKAPFLVLAMTEAFGNNLCVTVLQVESLQSGISAILVFHGRTRTERYTQPIRNMDGVGMRSNCLMVYYTVSWLHCFVLPGIASTIDETRSK
jgi:hypothetical protein